ncbi:MAG: RNA methyltransferase [Variovorax sp.]|nr:MAG: RNA methyltransferase [Variovorax sp.]
MGDVQHITSRDNALLKDLRKLAQDPGAYRKLGRLWLEGDHLCRAALARGVQPSIAVFSESFWPSAPAGWAAAAGKTVVVADALLAGLSGLESPAPMGFVIDVPVRPELLPSAATVVLDRLQDAGNVGSILRSASAFGFAQVVALKGTAALWAPKVLRAGMGAHFGLRLIEGVDPDVLDGLTVPLVATSSHQGDWLHSTDLPHPCAWLMGHEGQGVSPGLEMRAARRIRIAQPGGEESLNVAAAAAICLHASAAGARTVEAGRL